MYASPTEYVSPFQSHLRPVAMWIFATGVILFVVGLVVAAPLLLESGHPAVARPIYSAFGYVCHQIPDRSFFIHDHPLAICSRCSGLYAGFLCTMLAYPLFRSLKQTQTPDRTWLFLAAAPLTIDFSLGFFGIWDNTHSSRFATGALLGAVAVLYVMPGLMDLALRRRSSTPTRVPVTATNPISAENIAARLASAPSDYSAPHRRI